MTPPGGTTRTVETRNEKWTLAERGGLVTLDFEADLTPAERDELAFGTRVEFPIPDAPPLVGRVLHAGSPTINCGGMQGVLDDHLGGATYSASRLDEWKPRILASEGVSMEARATALFLKKEATKSGVAGMLYEFPEPTDHYRLTFSWARSAQASDNFAIFQGTPGGDANEPWTWALVYQQPTASGGTSGSYDSGLVSAAGIGALLIWCQTTNTGAAADRLQIASPRVYGTTAAATPAGIMGHIYGLVAGDVPTTDLEAVTDDVTDATFTRTQKLTERVTDVLNRGNWLARIEARSNGTGYAPCGVFERRPTTADHLLNCDGVTATAALEPLDWSTMASAVRVTYKRLDGGAAHVDVIDTNTDHPLVAAGITRWATIDIDTTDAAAASSAGATYLALRNAGVKGSVRIEGRHDFTPGHLITLTGTSRGTITARIKQADGNVAGTTLTLDDTTTWDEWIARLTR
jgi:hypothetical protein